MNTRQIKQYLQQQYRLPKWALFFEVPEKLGCDSTRMADAIAVNLETAKVIGFEIKASRGDWLRELKKPEKSACFVQLCNEFYIVAPPDVVYSDEIPDGWGHLVPGMDRACKKALHSVSRPLDTEFSLVLLRRSALMSEKYEAIRRIIESPVYDSRMFEEETQ